MGVFCILRDTTAFLKKNFVYYLMSGTSFFQCRKDKCSWFFSKKNKYFTGTERNEVI